MVPYIEIMIAAKERCAAHVPVKVNVTFLVVQLQSIAAL